MRSLLTLAGLALVWMLCSFAVLSFGSPANGGSALPGAISAVVFIPLAAWGVPIYLRRVEPCLRRRRWLRIGLILACLGNAVGMFFLVRHGILALTPAFVLGSANLLVVATLFGSWLAMTLKRPAELVPVCSVMAAADLISLWGGPTRQVVRQIGSYYQSGMEGPTPVATFLLIQVPMPGLGRLLPLFGVADWIMVVFLLAAMTQFDLDDNVFAPLSRHKCVAPLRPFLCLPSAVAGLLVAVLAAQGLGMFLPALPMVGLVFLVFLLGRFPSARSLQPIDLKVLLLTAALVAVAGIPRLGLL